MMAEKKKTTTKKTETKKQEVKKVAPVKQEVKKQAAPAPAAKQAVAAPGATTQQEARIGVFICHCGTNIAGSMDIPEVQEYAKTIPNVAYVDNYKYMSPPMLYMTPILQKQKSRAGRSGQ